MAYEIFKVLPFQQVIQGSEIFGIYSCGLFNNENVELVELQPQFEYKPHYHENSAAVIYIISGTGLFTLGDKLIEYQPNLRIEVAKGKLHGFKTNTSTLFLSIQSPPIISPKNGEIDLHYRDNNS